MPTLVVRGPDGLVRERLRTMALDVATSRVAIPLDVVIAGDDRLTSRLWSAGGEERAGCATPSAGVAAPA